MADKPSKYDLRLKVMELAVKAASSSSYEELCQKLQHRLLLKPKAFSRLLNHTREPNSMEMEIISLFIKEEEEKCTTSVKSVHHV